MKKRKFQDWEFEQINLVDFQHKQYKPFTQRKFSAVIGDWHVSGIVDFVIAKGIQHPSFFCMNINRNENGTMTRLDSY